MSGRIEFDFSFSSPRVGSRPDETDPMQILVLGDFSNTSASHQNKPLAERRIHAVDIDNLDTLPGTLAPGIELHLEGGLTVPVIFSTLDDFHPDSLYQRLSVFDELRDISKRLSNSQTFPEAAAQLRAIQNPGVTEATNEDTASVSPEGDSSTFERLLGRPTEADASQTGQQAHSAVERLIADAIKDQVVPEATVEQGIYEDAAEEAISKLMRLILQHPDFKALEAQWRGLEFLVRRCELGEDLKLFICDVSREEVKEDLQQAGNNLEHCGLFQRLVTKGVQTPGNSPWSLIVGTYTFGASTDDVAMLAALGAVSSQAGGPFLAAASPEILGCKSLPDTPNPHDWKPEDSASDNWNALRQSEVAPWIGLALPRLLMRLPYGENTDEIEPFKFEELTKPGNTDELLWGNPAFACAQLIAEGFTGRGWQMRPDDVQDIGDLPSYSYQDDGEWKLTPCSEVFLSETALNAVLQHGLMPLISLKNINGIRLLRFQSISDSKPALCGQWTP
ncbi:hypothetical protein MNBD_GAMMA15-460 [hydrothermal vent metagenome]|uniref:TssC1 N-terminal domain-containing protein n=1 Tax=hydrothermal vent metagenome TaxID=652676 RepID=A0A3B0YQK6_9ZZZZ